MHFLLLVGRQGSRPKQPTAVSLSVRGGIVVSSFQVVVLLVTPTAEGTPAAPGTPVSSRTRAASGTLADMGPVTSPDVSKRSAIGTSTASDASKWSSDGDDDDGDDDEDEDGTQGSAGSTSGAALAPKILAATPRVRGRYGRVTVRTVSQALMAKTRWDSGVKTKPN